MNSKDLVAIHTITTLFNDGDFILKAFEIYANIEDQGRTRITIIDAVTKHKCIIYFDYIFLNNNEIIKVAESIIKTGLS